MPNRAAARAAALLSHLRCNDAAAPAAAAAPTDAPTGAPCAAAPSAAELEALFGFGMSPVERRAREVMLADPLFRELPYEMNKREQRDLGLRQLQAFLPRVGFDITAFRDDPSRVIDLLAQAPLLPNFGMGGKFAVHVSLFGSTVLFLGTQRHHGLLSGVSSGQVLGSFAMTELRGGSNVKAVETTATYDKATSEFVLHTPSVGATKFWIGGIANHSTFAVVFARLLIDGSDKGVHVFLAQLRTRDGVSLPGVRLVECGQKIGVNCLDNGGIQFDHFRVPRTALLNRFSDVDEHGVYTSVAKNADQVFVIHMGELILNRMGAANACLVANMVGLATAIPFVHARRQFGPPNSAEEAPLISYRTTQTRLVSYLAALIASRVALLAFRKPLCAEISAHVREGTPYSAELHIEATALKYMVTWLSRDSLQLARECCGGQGYLSINRIGWMLADVDHMTTVEGDNVVLTQQVARYLLKKLAGKSASVPRPDVDQLDSSEKIGAALQWLLHAQVARVVAGLKADVAQHGQFGAWSRNLDAVVDLAKAYAFAQMFGHLRARLASQPTPPAANVAAVGDAVLRLFGLFALQQFRALATDTSSGFRAQLHAALDTVTAHSRALVDSLGVPIELLGPTAHPDWMERVSRETI